MSIFDNYTLIFTQGCEKMIGDNLKTIRKAKGLKAHDVVDELKKYNINISLSTYYAWENNERGIPHKYIPDICRVLKITIDFLYMTNSSSNMFEDKLDYIAKIHDFLAILDDNTCKLLVYTNRHWKGDFVALLNMLGAYASLPIEMRRDIANLCLFNYESAAKEGCIDNDISSLVDIILCKNSIEKLYK